MRWTDTVALVALPDGGFTTHVDAAWSSLQGVHGGVVAALAVAATDETLAANGVDPSAVLRAATFGYVAGNTIGELAIGVELIRRGRALTTAHVNVQQDGRPTTVARLHYSTPWEGPTYSDAPPPPVRAAGLVAMTSPTLPPHFENVDAYLHPGTVPFGGSARSEWLGWGRPRQGDVIDRSWLTMFGDYLPPSVFSRVTEPNRALSIEYGIQFHTSDSVWSLAEDEYVSIRMHAFHSNDGFAVEDAWLWHPDGTLLATCRQTRLAG